ncbi:uncharacterized protein ATNIH1004_006448 [Aspergillus tanneri]|uniref:Uncharacterized protein n=1 Tax=Aspergillus tanneri TaxID=1220188 RepID=A0A5M9MZC4_9EURO|nr:uncharacterized protein ATNIH1004_006448 [Aspergillus tanneri]KAA8647747.1 hypothetical protein ATNIH1004_006448 [Aspergillus tanneri]
MAVSLPGTPDEPLGAGRLHTEEADALRHTKNGKKAITEFLRPARRYEEVWIWAQYLRPACLDILPRRPAVTILSVLMICDNSTVVVKFTVYGTQNLVRSTMIALFLVSNIDDGNSPDLSTGYASWPSVTARNTANSDVYSGPRGHRDDDSHWDGHHFVDFS